MILGGEKMKVRTTIYLEEELKTKLLLAKVISKTDISDIVNEALENYFKNVDFKEAL